MDVLVVKICPREGKFEIAGAGWIVMGVVTITDHEQLDVIKQTCSATISDFGIALGLVKGFRKLYPCAF